MPTEDKTDLADDMSKVWDDLSQEEVEEDVEQEAADREIIIEASDEESDDEQAEAVEASADEDEAVEELEEAEIEAPEEESEEDDVEPLAHWKMKDKEMFKSLPKEAKEFLIDRDKTWQRQANEKIQVSAGVQRALDPIREEMTQYGVSDDQAIRTLVGAHKMLQNNPREGILRLMGQYQLSPEELFTEPAEGEKVDPRIEALENKAQQFEQLTMAQQQAAVAAKIEEFKKNAEFFDDVTAEMTHLAAVERAQNPGVVPDIEQLYNKACWMNEGVRAKLIDRQNRDASKEKSTQRSKRASGAKVKATPTARKRAEKDGPTSIRDDLSALYDELATRDETGARI